MGDYRREVFPEAPVNQTAYDNNGYDPPNLASISFQYERDGQEPESNAERIIPSGRPGHHFRALDENIDAAGEGNQGQNCVDDPIRAPFFF